MCLRNIYVPKYGVVVPCGKCPACKLKRVNAWVFRLEQEARLHKTSHFITLTYGGSPTITKNKFMTLDKKHCQNFFKLLRWNMHRNSKSTIKYYLAGEYGPQTWRPHYHAIVFDAQEDYITKSWPHGNVHFGDSVNANTIAYCCKYICKDLKIPMFVKDDRQREFSLMSKNMGANYITPETIRYHTADLNSFILKPGGHKMCLPRYYRDKIFSDEQRQIMNYNSQLEQVEKEREIIHRLHGRDEYDEARRQAYRHLIKNAIHQENLRNKL